MTEATTTDERLKLLEGQVARFAADITETTAQLRKTEEEREDYRKLVVYLKEEVERLRRGLVGRKAERFSANESQLTLSMLGLAMAATGSLEAEAVAQAVEKQLVAQHTRRKPVRKPLPAELPRVTIEFVPPEVEREPDAYEYIGSETREVLERKPAATVAVQLIYKKYVRRDRDRSDATEVLAPETQDLPIERGLAGPGFLADTIVKRWQDHMPLNRQEGIYGREGLDISRSTICTWHMELAVLARPLYDAMFVDALTAPYLCTDATGVLVLDKERCRNGHFWVLVAPDKHVLFRFSEDHDGKAVDALLPGYRGHLVADAHSVYEHLYVNGDVIKCGCWSHARRYWWKSLLSDPERAKIALAHIATLFRIERLITSSPGKRKREVRQEKSKPVADAFFAWCAAEQNRVLDESPAADAIGYAINQETALRRFLDDGSLPIHNNVSELNLRRQATGRKNWLFVGSEDGAEANTIFVSLLASCAMHKIEPLGYIRDLLCLLPRWPKHRILELAPAYWRQTIESPEVQRSLAANVFRQVVLGQRAGPCEKCAESASAA